MEPFYDRGGITLYNADFREVLAATAIDADCVIADPPYGETALAWDRWPDGWPAAARAALREGTGSMWCFGSMRMFLDRGHEFRPVWQLAQDVVWEKQNGSGFDADRFKRVHEVVTHWYPTGSQWSDVHHATPKVAGERRPGASIRDRAAGVHRGAIADGGYEYGDTRLARSVIYAANCHGYAENETQKPEALVRPLVEYACPPGGLVFSPFAGSGTDLVVARSLGRRAVGCELRVEQCEVIVRRLAQGVLFAG